MTLREGDIVAWDQDTLSDDDRHIIDGTERATVIQAPWPDPHGGPDLVLVRFNDDNFNFQTTTELVKLVEQPLRPTKWERLSGV